MTIKTTEREKAKKSFEKIKKFNTSNGNKKEYKSHIKSFPTMILQNGLGNAVAFAYSKDSKSKEWKTILEQIVEMIEGNNTIVIEDFIENKILKANTQNYRKLESEFLSYLNWLSRFAEGMIEDKKENSN